MRGIALVPLEVNEPSTTKPRLRVVFNIASTSVGMLRILHQSREELSGASGRLKFCNIVQGFSGGWHRREARSGGGGACNRGIKWMAPGSSGGWHRCQMAPGSEMLVDGTGGWRVEFATVFDSLRSYGSRLRFCSCVFPAQQQHKHEQQHKQQHKQKLK